MKIVLVIDQYDSENNGTVISARRFAQYLRKHGNDVKIIAAGKPEPNKFCVPERFIPLATYFAKKQGMLFAKPKRSVIKQALQGADVVHFMLPFKLGKTTQKIAQRMGIPTTAAFHLQPENITFNIKMKNSDKVADFIYWWFRISFYNRFTHIHCPSEFIANELRRHHYKAKLHVVSNGAESTFSYYKIPKPKELQNKFIILMIGRYAEEKRQDLIIEAVLRSKYKNQIQLIFAGAGPCYEKLKKLGDCLPNKPIMGFYSQKDLKDIIGISDLYVHAADVEIEAMSCIEAFGCGLVPIISDSKKSATKQFAIDKRSLFKASDAEDLKNKIEYFMEHPEERKELEHEYAKHAYKYNIDSCVSKVEEMYREAIKENNRSRE